MSLKSFELYIGANAKTGNLEVEKLTEITLKHYEHATIKADIIELRRDGQNKTVSIIVKSDQETLNKYIKELKKVLNLNEVNYHQVNKFKVK